MGNLIRGANGYIDVYKMNAFQTMDYHKDQRKFAATVQSYAQQQVLAQVSNAGFQGSNAGTTDTTILNRNRWSSWNNYLFQNAGGICALAIILGVLSYFVKEIMLLSFATFLFAFAIHGYVSQATLSGSNRQMVFGYKIISSALLIGLIAAIAVTVTVAPHFE